MKKRIEQFLQVITENYQEFLKFYKLRFPIYHKSNLFISDLYYCIQDFLKEKGHKIKFHESVELVPKVVKDFEEKNILKKIDERTWMLNYLEFLTPKIQTTKIENTKVN